MSITYHVCKYTPTELLTALGGQCALLDEAPENFDLSDQVAHPNLCGFGKSVIQAAMAGHVKELVLVNCCDTIRSAYDILKAFGNLDFLYLLDILHSQEGCSVHHARDQLLDLAEAYGAYKGTQFDRAAFFAAFQPKPQSPGPHIAVLGAKMGTHLFSLVEETMPLPAVNQTCAANRWVAPPEDEGDLPTLLEAYARNLLGQLPCMRMTDHTARRALYNTPGLEGVVYHTLQFCDYYGFEYAGLRSQLPVPLLKIESDGTTQSREQLRTRLEAFAEGFAAPQKGDNPMPSHGYFAGIDSGSATTDVVILDQDKTIVAKVILPTGAGASNGAQRALEEALQQAGLSQADLTATVTTGYGRGVIQAGDKSITEITCHAKGAHFLYPQVRTVIDIGGQDSKVIAIAPDGSVTNFVMNDKCAAGTGRFLEMMARTLELSLEEISTVGLQWKEEITISSMCTVFADSEVVSLVAQNKALPDIVHGLNQSVASRAAALYRRAGGTGPCMMTGGVARNQGVVEAIQEKLGQPLFIHPDAQ
ncbi:MAG: acyl-CoA dehydratase activase, partial [Evtepia sp.]|nr:acyl-CoA dehydratase activase [Evtepia sp.]